MLAQRTRQGFPETVQDPNEAWFLTRQEFDFVANEVGLEQLETESLQFLRVSPEDLWQQQEAFRKSVNQAPTTFEVPDDGGDAFFRKMNLALFMTNRLKKPQMERQLQGLLAASDATMDWINAKTKSNLYGNQLVFLKLKELKAALQGFGAQKLYDLVSLTQKAYLDGGGRNAAPPELRELLPIGYYWDKFEAAFIAAGNPTQSYIRNITNFRIFFNDVNNGAVRAGAKQPPILGVADLPGPGEYLPKDLLLTTMAKIDTYLLNNLPNAGNRVAAVAAGEVCTADWNSLRKTIDDFRRFMTTPPYFAFPAGTTWAGQTYDLLQVYAFNVMPVGQRKKLVPYLQSDQLLTYRRDDRMYTQPSLERSTFLDVLFNIAARLKKDAFYRENNFRSVLQDIGMTTEQFAKLVENATNVLYWPDCVASRLSLDEMRSLVAGLGLALPGPDKETPTKIELCSLILTSLGFKPEDFDDDKFRPDLRLGKENVARLRQIVQAFRRSAPPAGYLGLPDQKIDEGAYVMTGFTAHNVTMERAVEWLDGCRVDDDTRASMVEYARNQNVFDLMEQRQATARPLGMAMDFTREGIERRMEVQGTNLRQLSLH